ncbi:helix-turn-helix domain-containing protein [Alkalibaculum bacchi]|jgi:predicted site-specific integrase-resolvase|uniref:helix-turn-helix domain-containing protein n=1 Tax=Alkalibaculum bacchi TaxID=645887 RepID=UPI0026F010A6|nr:helix-turn-helix domain-containing protein [Alkalibaculum bacchi]
MEQREYTVQEVALKYDKSIETIRRWIRAGKMKAVQKTGNNGPQYFIAEEMLRDFEEQQQQEIIVVDGHDQKEPAEILVYEKIKQQVLQEIANEIDKRVDKRITKLEERLEERDRKLTQTLRATLELHQHQNKLLEEERNTSWIKKIFRTNKEKN